MIVGVGLPDTSQMNVTVSVSLIVLLVGLLIKLAGTTKFKTTCNML